PAARSGVDLSHRAMHAARHVRPRRGRRARAGGRAGRSPVASLIERLPVADTLDVRLAREFQVGHFASAVSIPLAALEKSLQLLPAKKKPLWVFGDDRDVGPALDILREHGYVAAEPHPAMAPGAAPARAAEAPVVGGEAGDSVWE